jgi:NAD(P) transhydrogenase subunit alpha
MIQDGELKLNFEDDIVSSACVTHAGEIRHPQLRELLAVNV